MRATGSIPFNNDIDDTNQPFVIRYLPDVLRGTGVSTSVGQLEPCSVVPSVHLKLKRGAIIREAMNTLGACNPGYRWQLDGDVLNLLPTSGIPASGYRDS